MEEGMDDNKYRNMEEDLNNLEIDGNKNIIDDFEFHFQMRAFIRETIDANAKGTDVC
jgi:hypothetical protein